ncbi:hypothetical protein [Saccharomonospora iraqiensis]|uniref:hypothetical protein n=1 Tax=Saccharomonospora iraqiensis TaxID=52698 RepID=UPI00022E4CAC|nr:hypothetical protein [Saccharomonospora iraqiensis]
MTGEKAKSTSSAVFVWRLLAGAFVAAVGVYLLLGSDNPEWLSALQVVAGVVLTLDATRHFRRSRRAATGVNAEDTEPHPGASSGHR